MGSIDISSTIVEGLIFFGGSENSRRKFRLEFHCGPLVSSFYIPFAIKSLFQLEWQKISPSSFALASLFLFFRMSSEIDSLSYRHLQAQCREAGLSAGGDTNALRKRLREHKEDVMNSPSTKRQKKSAEDDLLCPITLELPRDPVTAEDGRVYERAAIERHINSKRGRQLKSPMTNEKMGKRLVAAPQHKSLIETLVETKVIKGALAEKWKEGANEKKKMEGLLKKAGGGDIEAMTKVADSYYFGFDAFPEDSEKAYLWYDKARAVGNFYGMARVGIMLIYGDGVVQNRSMGLYYLSRAAEKGSSVAAYWLGRAFADGLLGLPVDKEEARKWIENALSTDGDRLDDENAKEAQLKLSELRSG